MLNLICLIIMALIIRSCVKKDRMKFQERLNNKPKTENSGFIPDYTAVDFNGITYKATKVRRGNEFSTIETDDLYDFLSFIADDIVVMFDTPKVLAKLERIMGESLINHTADALSLTRQLCLDVKDFRLQTVYEKLTGNGSGEKSTSYVLFRVFEGLKEYASNAALKLSASYPEPEWKEIYLPPEDFSSITPKEKHEQAFPGETITFTGRIDGMIRRQAIEKAVENGATYSPALTKATTILVIGDRADNQLIQQAAEQGAKAITGEMFKARLSSPSSAQ